MQPPSVLELLREAKLILSDVLDPEWVTMAGIMGACFFDGTSANYLQSAEVDTLNAMFSKEEEV
eukprot:6219409-Alexandrium_andersonii.AAC.1